MALLKASILSIAFSCSSCSFFNSSSIEYPFLLNLFIPLLYTLGLFLSIPLRLKFYTIPPSFPQGGIIKVFLLKIHKERRWSLISGSVSALPFLCYNESMKLPFDTTWNFLGLSTDTKPDSSDSRVVDGSTFLEVDTSKLYIYTRGRWYQKTSSVQTNLERSMKW